MSEVQAKDVARYELVVVVRQDVAASHVDALQATYIEMLQKAGGTLKHKEYAGLLTLAYPIGSNRRAHYFLMDIEGPAGLLEDVKQKMRLSPDVLRFLDVRVEAFGERPSVLSRGRSQWTDGKASFPLPKKDEEGGKFSRDVKEGA